MRRTRILTNYAKGQRAETLCCWVLRLKGYRILARRWRSALGEIDIIAARRNVLAIIEVKARPDQQQAASAVSLTQQRRLQNAAREYLAHHPNFNQYITRFDVMMVLPRRWPLHIPDAWPGARD